MQISISNLILQSIRLPEKRLESELVKELVLKLISTKITLNDVNISAFHCC